MNTKYTPGPWKFHINKTAKYVTLSGFKNGSIETVMDFVRYGMQSAKPRFNIDGLMCDADKIGKVVKDRKHHKKWYQELKHPDTLLIEAAPEMLECLIKLYKNLKSFGSNISKENAVEIIEKATGMSIEEVLNDS